MNRLRHTLLLTMSIALAAAQASCASREASRWDTYLGEPLTWIYPEAEAISNPPFFHWMPHPEAKSYRLTLRGLDDRFAWETRWNFFTPEETLAAGIYRVEIEAMGANGRSLGRSSHDFTLGPAAVSFALPLNAFPAPADPLFVTSREHLRGLQEGTRGQPYRDRLLEIASRGVPQDLRQASEPERYPNGVWNHALWQRNNSLGYRLEDAITQQALAYRLTGEIAHRDAAIALMRHIAPWPADGATGVWENDHTAQTLLRTLAVGYNLLQDELAGEAEAEIRAAIAARSRDMFAFLNPFVAKATSAGRMNDPDNNHPWFCASALAHGGMALLGREPEAEKWLAFSAQLFAGVFLPRGDRDGGWHEGIDYWSYTLYFVCQFADTLRYGTGRDFYQHPWLRHTGAFKVLTHPPVGAYVPFGSCKHNPPTTFDKMVMSRFASVHRDPLLWRYVEALPVDITHSRELFFAALWADEPVPHEGEVTLPEVVHYEDMGWVVANRDAFNLDNQVLFAFRSGPFFGRAFGHSQGDQNHFILTAGGEKLIWDAGYYDGYLTPHHRDFSVQSIAHNTILVDGFGQVVHVAGLDGRIENFSWDGSLLRFRGDASEPLIYGGRLAWFRRDIEFADWRHLTVSDDIFARRPARLSWLLHSVYPILYDEETRTIRIRGERYELRGVLESEHNVEGLLRHGFPVEPRRPAGREHLFPDQYHLELRTVDPVESWKPVVRFELIGPNES